MHRISKFQLLDARQCLRKLWLRTHQVVAGDRVLGSQTRRYSFGFNVSRHARTLHPEGILIDTSQRVHALAQTQQALRQSPARPVFEATFERDGVLVHVDVLSPEKDGRYQLRAVKASTRVKDHHHTDLAIQAWAVTDPPSSIALAHVNRDFIYAGDGHYLGLLKITAVDEAVRPLLSQVPQWVTEAQTVLDGSEPDIMPGTHCTRPYACPFQSHCNRHHAHIAYPLNTLPRLPKHRQRELHAQGIHDIRDIPEPYPLTTNQRRIADVIRTGQVQCDPEAQRIISALRWPRYFLDFETTAPAIPLWAGTRPYQPLPVQWSCHVQQTPHTTIAQHYLYEEPAEPFRAFAESLLHAVNQPRDVAIMPCLPLEHSATAPTKTSDPTQEAKNSPILVYNATFERHILRTLSTLLPDLTPALQGVSDRLVDLLPIVRRYYYHPAMQGSWSLKAVLPTLGTGLNYQHLVIGDGWKAQQAWLECLDPDTDPGRRDELRQRLIDYCGQDTWALVEIVKFFSR